MKLKLVSAALISLAMAGVTSTVAAEPAAFKKCKGCHTVDTDKMGPSFKTVAASGRDRATLLDSIKNGTGKGTGAYVGKAMMKSMPKNNVTDAEAEELVDFVLSQK